jgi:Cd(II)/Pb(II)-responsive transcriptional regulator
MSKPAPVRTYRIGDLARASGMRVENIRYYERVGLMPEPRRSAGNYRLYTSAERERLAFIQRCRSLDMSLDDVRRLIVLRETPVRSCRDVDKLLDERIANVGRRITALEELRRELRALRARCGPRRLDPHCAILNELSQGFSGEPVASAEQLKPSPVP